MYAKWIEADQSFSFSPSDNGGIEIDRAYYMQLLAQNSKGLGVVGRDTDGRPVLVDLPEPTDDELATSERAWRDAKIESVRWLRERHRDEVDSGRQTNLTPEQFKQLLNYLQALRDWPQAPDFPATEYRPEPPGWIAAQI